MEAVIAADPDLIVAATRNTATRHVGPDGELVEPLTEQHLLDVAEATGVTLDRLIEETDAQIVLIDTLPRLGDVDCLAANEQDPTACDTAADADRWATYNELVRGLASERSDRVSVISLEPHVCPNGTTCGAIQDGVVVSYDGVHFTGTYSASLDSVIDELLSSVGTDLDSL